MITENGRIISDAETIKFRREWYNMSKSIPVAVCCKDCEPKKMIPVISKYLNVYCPKCRKVLYDSGLSLAEAGRLIQEENKENKRLAELKDQFEHFELIVRSYFPSAKFIYMDDGRTKAISLIKYYDAKRYMRSVWYLVCTSTGLSIKSKLCTKIKCHIKKLECTVTDYVKELNKYSHIEAV